MLAGEIAITGGSVELLGHDVTAWPQPRRAQAGLGRSYQRTTIFPALHRVRELPACRAGDAPVAVELVDAGGRVPGQRRGRVRRARAAPGSPASRERVAGLLSHGEKRQLEIAMCLATRPRVLLLDEPLAGMGPEETERMLGSCSPGSRRDTRSCWSSTTWTRCFACRTGSR